ncbi:alpha/beta fold hydrolase [Asticcacaulis tiandongensis]|uniref:alpha/beta fold hydrolase n=1 Tax=Asticcacaulis tiandongensis TaxID=2565365 RepID=UPI0011288733|nr:alpha/beta hydrolase [Asticcacaulis tiandongensis]
MSRIAALSSQAPLMAIPEARPPAGGVGEWYRGAGGLRLRLGFWQPEGTARGTVFVSPGRTEPVEKYYEVVGDLLARGFAVVVHDWRGQGLSARLMPDRLKGHARSESEYLDDYQRLLDAFEDRAPKPWLMIGHSMGAALNLATLIQGETRISGAIFINPMLRVKTGRHSLWAVTFQTDWKVRHGLSSDYVPELFDDPFEHTFERDALTHDERRYNLWREQLFACPHLGIGSPTWGWLHFALKLGETLIRDKGKLVKKVKTPVSIICSGDDSLIMRQPSKAFARKLPLGRYVEVAGAEHEILMELDEYRQQFWDEFDVLLGYVFEQATPATEPPATELDAPTPQAETEAFDSRLLEPEAEDDTHEVTHTAVTEPEGEVHAIAVQAPSPAEFVAYELSDVPERVASPTKP